MSPELKITLRVYVDTIRARCSYDGSSALSAQAAPCNKHCSSARDLAEPFSGYFSLSPAAPESTQGIFKGIFEQHLHCETQKTSLNMFFNVVQVLLLKSRTWAGILKKSRNHGQLNAVHVFSLAFPRSPRNLKLRTV